VEAKELNMKASLILFLKERSGEVAVEGKRMKNEWVKEGIDKEKLPGELLG